MLLLVKDPLFLNNLVSALTLWCGAVLIIITATLLYILFLVILYYTITRWACPVPASQSRRYTGRSTQTESR
jgi:hypothetical protein